jgi:hypothetical protein
MNETVNHFAQVAHQIDPIRVVINKGSDDGVKMGARFLVYRIGPEIKDPETGKDLGKLEIIVGTAKVTHLQNSMATLESLETRRVVSTNALRGLGVLGTSEYEYTAASLEAKIGDLVKPI